MPQVQVTFTVCSGTFISACPGMAGAPEAGAGRIYQVAETLPASAGEDARG